MKNRAHKDIGTTESNSKVGNIDADGAHESVIDNGNNEPAGTADIGDELPAGSNHNNRKRRYSVLEQSLRSPPPKREDSIRSRLGSGASTRSPPANRRRTIPPSGMRRSSRLTAPMPRHLQTAEGGLEPGTLTAQTAKNISSTSAGLGVPFDQDAEQMFVLSR